MKMTPPVKKFWSVPLLAAISLLGWLNFAAGAAPALPTLKPAGLPLYFEANQGQADSPARFIARGRNSLFLISPATAQFVLAKTSASPAASARSVKLQFLGANNRAPVSGAEELSGKINYFVGDDPAHWRTGVATFARVRVRQLYPGINLDYHGNQRRLEYDFTVAPGADPHAIAIRFEGADKVSINPAGELVLNLGNGEIVQPKPLMYQTVRGARREVAGGYKMLDSRTVSFAIGDHDRRQALVIDPLLSYATYFGGNGADAAWAVAVDPNDGSVYVAGQTTSTQFKNWVIPPGSVQTNFQGGSITGDAFVAKLDNLGTNLLYLAYLGGSGEDLATAITVDGQGNAYVAGATASPNFPTTTNAPERHISGTATAGGYPLDSFIAKLNPGGSNLLYSTYLGGSAADGATAIALDSSNNVYMTGYTYSTNLPATPGAYQTSLQATNWAYQAYYNANAFLAEIAASGTNLLYVSYFGGTNFDAGEGIAVDRSNCVYVDGFTGSVNFPNTNSFQKYLNGTTNATRAYDAFVAKFTPGFGNLAYATFLGGTNSEVAYRLAVDGSGKAYATGWTDSTNFPNTVNLPGLANGLANNAVYGYPVTTNAFLTQVVWNGTNAAIGYSAVFGGTNFGIDIGYGVTLDPAGDAFVVGATTATNFPANAPDALAAANTGGFDAFVTVFSPNAGALLYSGCLGGAANDFGYGIAADSAGNAYFVGQTLSANFPTNDARQAALNGTSDAFLAEIILTVVPPDIATQPTNQSAGVGSTVNLAVSVTGTPPFTYQWQVQKTNLTWTNLVNGGSISGAADATLTIRDAQTNNSGPYQVIVTNYAGAVTSSVAVLTVTNVLPVITTQPESQTVGVGSSVSFSVYGIDGTLPEFFQWLKDGTILMNGTNVSGSVLYGATNNVLTIANVQTNDAGTYWLAITNPAGVVTSSQAVLTVVTFPTILVPPTNQIAGLGAVVNFSVTAAGLEPLSYRWLMDGTNAVGGPISGANTNATLTLTNTQIGDSGRSFSVIVTNLAGAVTSSPPAVLTVLAAPRFTSITSEGGTNFNISGGGGTNRGAFYVLTTTNLALPLTNWTSRGSSFFDSQGSFNFTYSLTNTLPQEFLILQMQSP
jgi:Immunoglobulin I-set domain/Immunoglobulin domain/Beta-propeller repeat